MAAHLLIGDEKKQIRVLQVKKNGSRLTIDFQSKFNVLDRDVRPWPWPWHWVLGPGLTILRQCQGRGQEATELQCVCWLLILSQARGFTWIPVSIFGLQQQLVDYIGKVNNSEFEDDVSIVSVCEQFPLLKPLFQYVFCIPASSTPVERIFSQSGLIMRPNRARMTDSMLDSMRCNSRLWLTETFTGCWQYSDHKNLIFML